MNTKAFTGHSPSPWNAGKGGYADRVYDANDPMATVCEIYYGGRSREEIAANRALIAAAPELLAACERMADAIDAVRGQHFSMDDNVFNPDSYCVPADVLTELFTALDDYDEWMESQR